MMANAEFRHNPPSRRIRRRGDPLRAYRNILSWRMPVETKRSSKVECLRCGHSGVLLESLSDYGVKSDAPIATFIKRLTCRACGNSR